MVEWLLMSYFPSASSASFLPPCIVRCWAHGSKTAPFLVVRSNRPHICQGSSNCASNFSEVLSTIWQQQESERLNELSKQSQGRKLSYCCHFLFCLFQWKHAYWEWSCWLASQWLTCSHSVKPLAPDAQGLFPSFISPAMFIDLKNALYSLQTTAPCSFLNL